MYSARLEVLKTLSSIGSPGVDGGAVEFWISGWGGSGSFSKRPSTVPSYRMNTNLLAQWKIYLGTVAEDKKTALHKRMRRVTWDWCVTWRCSNSCVDREFGKYALTTADGRKFLRSTEHCPPWPRRSSCYIGEGVRRMFEGGQWQ